MSRSYHQRETRKLIQGHGKTKLMVSTKVLGHGASSPSLTYKACEGRGAGNRDIEGQTTSIPLKALIQGYKVGRGCRDRKRDSGSKMIEGEASVMEPCYSILWP